MTLDSVKRGRGFTLIESVVAVGVMGAALVWMCTLVLNTTRLARNAERTGDTQDGARLAGDTLANDLRRAGMGAAGGIWTAAAGLSPVRVNAVYGTDGVGTDDIWMVVPDKNTFQNTTECNGVTNTASGSATIVVADTPPGQALPVACSTNFQVGDLLLVTNMTSSALITVTALVPQTASTSGSITFLESTATSFSDSPQRGAFAAGDMVYRVRALHYFIAPMATGLPGLFREVGKPTGDVTTPFQPPLGTPAALVQAGVEDLQVAYGLDTLGSSNPDNYTYLMGLAAGFAAGLKTVRVNVVAMSGTTMKNDDQMTMTSYASIPQVENHVGLGYAGYQRIIFSRRVELTNLAPENL